jgi:hypothetical protein
MMMLQWQHHQMICIKKKKEASIAFYKFLGSLLKSACHYINKALSLKHRAPTASHSLEPIHISFAESNLLITEAPFHTNTSGSNSLGAGNTSTRSIMDL